MPFSSSADQLAPIAEEAKAGEAVVAVVIDICTDVTRVGLAGDDVFVTGPSLELPPDQVSAPSGIELQEWNESTSAALAKILTAANIDVKNRPICMTESVAMRANAAGREAWVKFCFENLHASAVFFALQPQCALFTLDRAGTGVVVDRERATVIHDDAFLSSVEIRPGYAAAQQRESRRASAIATEVNPHPHATGVGMRSSGGGDPSSRSKETVACSLRQASAADLAQAAYTAIFGQSDFALWFDLTSRIVLTGYSEEHMVDCGKSANPDGQEESAGTSTNVASLCQAVLHELKKLAPNSIFTFNVVAAGATGRNANSESNARCADATWYGAGMVAGLNTRIEPWIQRAEYEKHGTALVHRKCQ